MSMKFGEDSKRSRSGVTPAVKAKVLKHLKLKLIEGDVSPSYLLGCAEDFECIDEMLQTKEAAYLLHYYTMLNDIRMLILVDNKDQFASFLRTKRNRDLVLIYPAPDIFMMLCRHSAVGCAAAFLEDPLIPLDVNSILKCHMTPLHLAANNLSYGMTNLLLHYGADPHINVSLYGTPLYTALHAIRKNRLILSDKLMVSSTEGDFKTTPVGQHIYQVLGNESLQREICEHGLSKEMLVKNLTMAWDVVETLGNFFSVLDHTRVENVPMYGVPVNTTGELKAAGSDDNIKCLLPKFTSEAKVLPRRTFFGEPGRPFPILQSLTGNHMPVIGTSNFPSSFPGQHRSFHLYEAIQVKPSSCTLIALSRACPSLLWCAKKIIK